MLECIRLNLYKRHVVRLIKFASPCCGIAIWVVCITKICVLNFINIFKVYLFFLLLFFIIKWCMCFLGTFDFNGFGQVALVSSLLITSC